MLYDLWNGYLRAATEQVVASHFEVGMIMESSNVWFQGDLFNMGGVRRFYHYQSRLLQGGFSALFGAKLQELYLKISFVLANLTTSGSSAKLPDVLGIIARTKGSTEAVASTNEISRIGQFTCDSESARHHEKGIIAYAQRSVQYDMEFLEAIRDEACAGMDAFDVIMEVDAASDSDRVAVLSAFLMQVLERMANRFEGFYVKLARYSVFQPEMEQNPARARWSILKRRIFDGSFSVLTRNASFTAQSVELRNPSQNDVDFDQVISQINMNLNNTSLSPTRSMDLNEQHAARAMTTSSGAPVYEQHNQQNALKAMSSFMDTNRKAIRRLSKLPQAINFDQLMQTYGTLPQHGRTLPTPPLSRSSSTSSARNQLNRMRSRTLNDHLERSDSETRGRSRNTTTSSPSTPMLVSPAATMSALMTRMNARNRSSAPTVPSPPQSASGVAPVFHRNQSRSMHSYSAFPQSGPSHGSAAMNAAHMRSRSSTTNLRSFRLQASAMASGMNRRSEV